MDAIDRLPEYSSSQTGCILATIIATSGSTPAGALSKMLILEDGTRAVGTVGGGCMEGDVLREARRLCAEHRADVLTFHLNEDEVIQGLICGGSLDVLIEPVAADQRALYENLRTIRNSGEDCVIATHVDGQGGIAFKGIVRPDNENEKQSLTEYWKENQGSASPHMQEFLQRILIRSQGERLPLAGGELILEPVTGRPHLVVFGGGHVSLYITRTAAMAGFRVTVVDDREQFANKERFPEADETIAAEYYDAFKKLVLTPNSYVVIVTRGHRSDEEILGKVCALPLKYIGMIGSRRKVLTTFRNLMKDGLARDLLEQVHAPMGLDIGAATAEEIAVSIVAELIHVRRGSTTPVMLKSTGMAALLRDPELP